MRSEDETTRERVDSIINNDPFRYERPNYRPSSWYLLFLAFELTAIIVLQFTFLSIVVSFKLVEFLPLPCFSLLTYVCTVIALARPCRLLLLPHIIVESVITLIYFTLSSLTIRDVCRLPSDFPSTVFRDVQVGRAMRFGLILLFGFPFQFFLILVLIRRYYVGFV